MEVVVGVEEHQEPYGLAVGEVEHQGQISVPVEAAGQTVDRVVVQTVVAAVEGVVVVVSFVVVEGVAEVAFVAAAVEGVVG